MLPKSLSLSRFRNGTVTPYKLQPTNSNLELASKLVQLFQDSNGVSRSEIDLLLKDLSFDKRNPKVVQGLADILTKRSEFSIGEDTDPVLLREQVFSASAEYWRSNQCASNDIVYHKKYILRQLDLSQPADLHNTESWLFSDVPGNQILTNFETLSAEDLLNRYNLEQVQCLLFQAQELSLRIFRKDAKAFRQIMQTLKFHQLMFTLNRDEKSWLDITVDGPASILENSRSYGLELALFFPSLLMLKTPWFLKTQIKPNKNSRQYKLELSFENDYVTSHREKRVWINERIEQLIQRLNEKYSDEFVVSADQQLLPIGKNLYLIPDMIIVTGSTPHRKYFLEWIPYQSDWKWKWLKRVKGEIPDNYIFAIKGNTKQLKLKAKSLGINAVIYTSELTAPKIYKFIKEVS